MKINLVKVTYEDLNENARFSEMLRGYLGNKYKENNLLHNHDEDKFIYRYPLIQYKVINKKPIIIGINEAVSSISKIALDEDELYIQDNMVYSFQKSIKTEEFMLGIEDDYIEYEFKTPWIALNQKNIGKYKKLNNIEKDEFLKKILIGNILSLSKGLGYSVDKQLLCWIDLKEKTVNLKNVKQVAFTGRIKINFNLPDYLGIGKSVSRGFGTLIKA